MVPELIPVLGSQPAGDVSHKPGGRLPLLSTRPAVTLATLKRAATMFDHGLTQILHDDLHWLDVADRVTYKLVVIMHRCRHGKAPQYLVDC